MYAVQSELIPCEFCLDDKNVWHLHASFSFTLKVCLSILCLSFIFCANADANDDIVVVVNKANPISELSKKQVIDIYMGRYLSFPDGESALPIDFPANSSLKQQFYLLLVNQSERKVKSYWSRLLFSGRAKPPIEARSQENAILMVEQTLDAIAYLSRDQVTSEMKIVYQFKS